MKFTAYHYKIPFATPFKTSKKTFDQREGLILEYRSDNYSCYGEAAPLPGFSKENLYEVIQQFENFKKEFRHILGNSSPVRLLQEWKQKNELLPALAFGIDTVTYQLAARRDGKTLQEYLFEKAPPHIPVNALVSLDSSNIIREVLRYKQKGYETIKFKVGSNFDKEYKQLNKVRSRFPNLNIRVDANQSWKLNEALVNCQKLLSLNIQYCEEPLNDPSPKNFEKLFQNVTLPIAIDESIIRSARWEELLPFTSYVILKPMLLGSFTKIFETNRLAIDLDNKAIFTTSLESGIGQEVTAILASGLGTLETAHGLATGSLLTQDIHPDNDYLANGAYRLHNREDKSKVDLQKLKQVSTIIS